MDVFLSQLKEFAELVGHEDPIWFVNRQSSRTVWPITIDVTTQVVFQAKEDQPITLEVINSSCLHAA